MRLLITWSDRLLATMQESEQLQARIGLWTSIAMAFILSIYGVLLWTQSQVTLAVLWLSWALLFVLTVIVSIRAKRIIRSMVHLILALMLIVPFIASLIMGSISKLAYPGFLFLVPLIAIIFVPMQLSFWTFTSACMLLVGILIEPILVLDPNLPTWFIQIWFAGPTLVSLLISALILSHFVNQRDIALGMLDEEREKLKQMSISDPLTGAFNRRHFFERGEQLHAQFLRYQHPYAVLMFDMDGFKKVNDRYGHLVGDVVLCEVVKLLQNNIRNPDIFARYGGEEFILLMPETNIETASTAAERLCSLIGSSRIQIGKFQLTVSISVGVAVSHPGLENFQDLVECSDQAVYQAKHLGRNCVVLFDTMAP
jgi:diguanylate cyclase (GGDEF)-like protein